MKIQAKNNNTPSFGTNVRISEKGMATLRNYELHNHGLKGKSIKQQIARLSQNGKENTLFVDGNTNSTNLTIILVDWIDKRYSEVQYALENLTEGSKLSLYKIYKNLDTKIKMLKLQSKVITL